MNGESHPRPDVNGCVDNPRCRETAQPRDRETPRPRNPETAQPSKSLTLPRPRHRLGEPRQRRRQLLDMRAGDAIQLPLQHTADRGLLLVCPVVQHVDVMPRQPDAQLRAPDRLRQDAVRLVPERCLI